MRTLSIKQQDHLFKLCLNALTEGTEHNLRALKEYCRSIGLCPLIALTEARKVVDSILIKYGYKEETNKKEG